MPIYEYKCGNCGHEFELIRGASDDDKDIVCPECGERKAERRLSLVAASGGCTASSCAGCSSSFT